MDGAAAGGPPGPGGPNLEVESFFKWGWESRFRVDRNLLMIHYGKAVRAELRFCLALLLSGVGFSAVSGVAGSSGDSTL